MGCLEGRQINGQRNWPNGTTAMDRGQWNHAKYGSFIWTDINKGRRLLGSKVFEGTSIHILKYHYLETPGQSDGQFGRIEAGARNCKAESSCLFAHAQILCWLSAHFTSMLWPRLEVACHLCRCWLSVFQICRRSSKKMWSVFHSEVFRECKSSLIDISFWHFRIVYIGHCSRNMCRLI